MAAAAAAAPPAPPATTALALTASGVSAALAEGAWRWGLASTASALSETVTYPLDMLKTRLQLQNELGGGGGRGAGVPPPPSPTSPPPRRLLGMVGMLRGVVRTEGWRALFAGLGVAVLRQVFNAGVSVALYPTVRRRMLGEGETAANAALWKRAAAGLVTGCLGQALANPADVVKVRLQADGRLRLLGGTPRYTSARNAFATIWRADGLRGLYTGLGTSVWRAGIINSAGIASYDGTKQWAIRAAGTSDGMAPAALGALVCGVVTTVVSAPLDVVKTRIMNDPARYAGPNDALVRLVRTEGVRSLYKGFVPTYQRQAIFNFVFWTSYEWLQGCLGRERL